MNARPRSHLQRPTAPDSLAPLTGVLKRSISIRLGREFGEALPAPLLHRAIEEAEAVAHSTGFADLFFPVVAEEKVRLVASVAADGPFHKTDSRLRTAA